jgi:hypothetical protein
MRYLYLLSIGMLVLLFSYCGENEPKDKKEEAKLSEKGELLCSVTWKYDTNQSLKGATDQVKDTTGVTADVVLKDDVGAIADFLTGTLRFVIDNRGDLAYERKYGKGLLATSVLGYWNFDEDETHIVMREWDDTEGKEKAPEKKKIIELSKDRLVLQDSDGSQHVYVPAG